MRRGKGRNSKKDEGGNSIKLDNFIADKTKPGNEPITQSYILLSYFVLMKDCLFFIRSGKIDFEVKLFPLYLPRVFRYGMVLA